MATSAPPPRTAGTSPLIDIGAAVTLTVRGEVDTLSARALERAAGRALRCAPHCLVLDLAGVTFFSASAIATLARVRRAARLRGTEFEIVRAAPPVTRVLARVDRGLERGVAGVQG